MRERMATAAVVALLAVAFGGVVRTATAGSAPATTEIAVVVGEGGSLTELDFMQDGLSQGDRVVFRGPLVDLDETHQVGRVKGECVVVSDVIRPTSGLWRCSYLLELAAGDLIIEGLDPRGQGSSTFAILGGTETYRTAAGDADLVDTDMGTEMYLHIGG
jgi:hypothetical protein